MIQNLLLLLVHIVDAEQSSGECRQFAETNQHRLMYLPFRCDEYAAKEHNQSTYRQHRRGD